MTTCCFCKQKLDYTEHNQALTGTLTTYMNKERRVADVVHIDCLKKHEEQKKNEQIKKFGY